MDIPRDRLSTIEPQLIAPYQRRVPGFDDHVISLYARGMSVREIRGHLLEWYGLEVWPDLISTITDEVWAEGEPWQTRPLDSRYPLVYFDARRLKIRDAGRVSCVRHERGWMESSTGLVDRTDRGGPILAESLS